MLVNKHARLVLLFSFLLLSLVALDFVALSKNFTEEKTNKPKERIDIVEAVNELGSVLSATKYYYRFETKEAGTDNYFEDATATVVNTDSFKSSNACVGEDGSTASNTFYISYYRDSYYELACGANTTMTVLISKTGYQTKQVSLTPNSNYSGPVDPITVVDLTKTQTTTTTPTKKTTSTQKTEVKVETIKDVTLPDQFRIAGSKTTDLTKIADISKVTDLTLDTSLNTIKFKETVDLSSTDTKDKFKTLGTYVKEDKVGVIGLDSEKLAVLNKKATLTMKHLTFVKTPKVLVNGKVDPTVVSNIHYKDGNLTFDVTHFSTFTAAPTVGITDPANGLETKDNPINLRGTVSDPTASVSAKLNNRNLGKLKVATKSGVFESQITLDEGANKIEVLAVSPNGATASASVSATLLNAAGVVSIMPYYIIAALLAFIAALSFLFAVRALKKHHTPKKPGPEAPNQSKPSPVPPVQTTQTPLNTEAAKSSGTPWENTPTPKIS